MDFNQIYTTIINEPIYLTISIIFLLIAVNSILKKFFKLLIGTLAILFIYIGFLIYTGEDLPGDSEELINPLIDNAGKIIDSVTNQLKSLSEDKD